MIPFFEDLWTKIQSRIGADDDAAGTTTVFARLRQIHDAISTRAAASTALSTAQWTNGRAGYIDKLNSGGIPGTVKSVQRGYVSQALDGSLSLNLIPISKVDPSKSVLFVAGNTMVRVEAPNNFLGSTGKISSIVSVDAFGWLTDDGMNVSPIFNVGIIGGAYSTDGSRAEIRWSLVEYF